MENKRERERDKEEHPQSIGTKKRADLTLIWDDDNWHDMKINLQEINSFDFINQI